MRYNARYLSCAPRYGARYRGKTVLPHYFGKPAPYRKMAVAALWGLLLVAAVLSVQPAAAQTEGPASIFSPWSDQDVRQGAQPRPDARSVPREFRQPTPAAMPKDIRRSSEPSADAIPIYRKSGRDDLEDIRLGSRPDSQRAGFGKSETARPAGRDSFITLQPFSDTDVRQGSRKQQSAAAQPRDMPGKPVPQQPQQEQKGFFGRVLEKIGF